MYRKTCRVLSRGSGVLYEVNFLAFMLLKCSFHQIGFLIALSLLEFLDVGNDIGMCAVSVQERTCFLSAWGGYL